ncbi:hypothetical protein K1719_018228 [Acacia pycnantha]|nr:hypothetical protein K1719_018228 [Acacia pycnantha]
MGRQDQQSEGSGDYESRIGISLEESLSTALDSFDNLFCRQCMGLSSADVRLSLAWMFFSPPTGRMLCYLVEKQRLTEA